MNVSARLYGITVPLEIAVDGGRVVGVSAPRAKETYQRVVDSVGKQIAGGKTLLELLHRNAEIGDLLRALLDVEEAQRGEKAA